MTAPVVMAIFFCLTIRARAPGSSEQMLTPCIIQPINNHIYSKMKAHIGHLCYTDPFQLDTFLNTWIVKSEFAEFVKEFGLPGKRISDNKYIVFDQ